MQRFAFALTLERIEQHIECLQDIIAERAKSNFLRVWVMARELGHALKRTYKEGEGWIEKDVHSILDAVTFAAIKHEKQVRKDCDQTSYLVHPLSVAHHLIVIGHVRDPEIIIAGLLHDTLEDTMTSYEELMNLFGKSVADFVYEVTDNPSLPKEERKKRQILTAPEKSSGAAQIKLADKWDNLTDLLQWPVVGWSEERVEAYFQWAKEVIDALPWVNAKLLRAVEEVINKREKKKT